MQKRAILKTYRLPLFGAAIFLLLLSLGFFERRIHNDEAWIGQQVLSLTTDGVVISELFGDLPPLDREIVVYHKLLVWAGVLDSKIFGWGLYQLRAISAVSGLLLLFMIFTFLRGRESPNLAAFTLLILMFAPIYWEQMLEFRPEALLVLCGGCGFLLLWRAFEIESWRLYFIAGLLSGLAGLTHAFGFACVVAGIVALLVTRKWIGAIIFGIAGAVAFAPYLSGYFSTPELFHQQMFDNPLMTTHFDYKWWHLFTNLVEEHKRILRKPEVIGLTISFLLALPLVLKEQWKTFRLPILYLAGLFAVIGISPLPKFTRYMIPLVPVMAIIIAQVWVNLSEGKTRGRRWISVLFLLWQVVFFGYGTFALLREAIPDRYDQLATNEAMLHEMRLGTKVIAPFDFVYPADPEMQIYSWWGAIEHDDSRHDIAGLEHYADSLGIDYLIIGPEAIDHWGLQGSEREGQFSRFELRESYSTGSTEPRYLMKRKSAALEQ